MKNLSKQRLQEIRERLEGAQSGIWEIPDGDINGCIMRIGPIAGYDYDALCLEEDDPNAIFVKHAHEDIKDLLEEVEAPREPMTEKLLENIETQAWLMQLMYKELKNQSWSIGILYAAKLQRERAIDICKMDIVTILGMLVNVVTINPFDGTEDLKATDDLVKLTKQVYDNLDKLQTKRKPACDICEGEGFIYEPDLEMWGPVDGRHNALAPRTRKVICECQGENAGREIS